MEKEKFIRFDRAARMQNGNAGDSDPAFGDDGGRCDKDVRGSEQNFTVQNLSFASRATGAPGFHEHARRIKISIGRRGKSPICSPICAKMRIGSPIVDRSN
ncbi:MAG: hypothetical protein ACI915_001173 [Gammaproteobacteria bacterium]|jgi:hypothetical protein